MSLLELQGVTVRYGGAVLAADNVSFDVVEGGSVALLGANGAGKTSILRAIGGLLPFHRGQVTHGDIRFAGASVVGRSSNRIVAAGVGQALEGRRVFTDLTVAENLDLGAFSARKAAGTGRAEIVDLFPRLGERLGQTAGTLSGGEQQMLAIGRALMARPRLRWGDDGVPGMKHMLADVEKYSPDQHPSVYFTAGYAESKMLQAVLKKAIASGDLTRQGILDAKKATYDGKVGPPSRVSLIQKIDPDAVGFLTTVQSTSVSSRRRSRSRDPSARRPPVRQRRPQPAEGASCASPVSSHQPSSRPSTSWLPSSSATSGPGSSTHPNRVPTSG